MQTYLPKVIVLLFFCLFPSSLLIAQSVIVNPVQTWRSISDRGPSEFVRIGLGSPIAAGDINNDGKTDYFFTGVSNDERTEDLGDRSGKTSVFFGGNFSQTPDQEVYSRLYPAGDLNSDGFADALSDDGNGRRVYYLGSPSGYESTEITHPERLRLVKHGEDLDADGYQDVLMFENISLDISVVWGGPSAAEFDTTSHTLPLSVVSFNIGLGDREADGHPEIVVTAGDNQLHQFGVFQFDASRTLQQIQLYDYFNESANTLRSTCEVFVENLDGVEGDEVLLRCVRVNTFEAFWADSTGGYETTLEPGFASEFKDNILFPAGDLNGDAVMDWYFAEALNQPVEILYGPIAENRVAQMENRTPIPDEYAALPVYTIFGDLDGNGSEDGMLRSFSDSTITRIALLGSSDSELSFTKTEYILSDYPSNRFLFTADLGDINADGTPDFAIANGFTVDADNPENRLEIFFGGNTLPGTASAVIRRGTAGVTSTTSGDFNNDGYTDVVVGYDTSTLAEGAFELYYGGPAFDNTPDMEWPYGLFADEGFRVEGGNVLNAGDLNADGIEDLLVVLPHSPPSLILGGENMAAEPDIELTYPEFSWLGQNMLALGDINGDGIDDVAIVDLRQTYGESSVSGVVYVHFGNTDLTEIATPDLFLTAPDTEDTSYSLFGIHATAGDYNGDGYNDLVTGPAFYRLIGEVGLGGSALFFYYGGPEFDEVHDVEMSLPWSFFGVDAPGNVDGNLAEVTFIPDLNGDGANELLIGSGPSGSSDVGVRTNAVILPGGATEDIQPLYTLHSPNQGVGMTSNVNNIFSSLAHSAVNDYNNNGRLDIIIPQISDNNDAFQSSRAYRFEMPEVGTANETQPGVFERFTLKQNYPNPFHNKTTIEYEVSDQRTVRIAVYDILGREVVELVNKQHVPGRYAITFDGSPLSNGVYMYALEVEGKRELRQMVVLH